MPNITLLIGRKRTGRRDYHINVLKAVLKAVPYYVANLKYHDNKNREKHQEPDKGIGRIKLCSNNPDRVHPGTEMERETKTGSKTLPGPYHYP